ncbi:MAG: hypothetical protein NTV94_16925 [Planctomycetota bacterium]|nr:hypothetical protein [Planctomycetota bacterium]
MKYISTRDNKKTYNFVDTFLNGLAHDGGLYIPKKILRLSKSTLKRLSKLNYNDLAYEIIKIYTGNAFSKNELKKIIKKNERSIDHEVTAAAFSLRGRKEPHGHLISRRAASCGRQRNLMARRRRVANHPQRRGVLLE